MNLIIDLVRQAVNVRYVIRSGCGQHRRMCSGHSVDSAVTIVFRQCMARNSIDVLLASMFILDRNSVLMRNGVKL